MIDNREHIRDIGKRNSNTKIFSGEFKWEKRVPVILGILFKNNIILKFLLFLKFINNKQIGVYKMNPENKSTKNVPSFTSTIIESCR